MEPLLFAAYDSYTGSVLSDQHLLELYNGLKANNIHLSYSHLMTGYNRDPKSLSLVCDIVKELKEVNPNLIYRE